MELQASFFLKISVYKHRNSHGYVYAREIRVDSEPALLGRSLSVHELRHIFKKREYQLQYERRSAGKMIYSLVKRKPKGNLIETFQQLAKIYEPYLEKM